MQMAINLLEMVKAAVTGPIVEQIGAVLGLDRGKASAAVNAVLPVLLGGMMKAASTPSGAAELAKSLSSQDSSVLDNFGSQLSGGNSSSLMAMGAKYLPMLLGSNQGAVVGSLTRMLGVGSESINSLLGMLAPVVMAIVGKQVKVGGLDAGSLARLLSGQAEYLAPAIPSEMRSSMGIANLTGDSSAPRKKETAAVAREVSPLAWALPLVGLGLIGLLAWNMFKSPPKEPVEPAVREAAKVVVPEIPVPALPTVNIDDLKAKLSTTFNGLTGALESIKDEASATSAVAKLKEAADQYNALGLDKLPETVKTALGPFLKPLFEKVKAALENAYALPGIKGVIEPVIGPMVDRVSAFVA
jgi:hypothetical protein